MKKRPRPLAIFVAVAFSLTLNSMYSNSLALGQAEEPLAAEQRKTSEAEQQARQESLSVLNSGHTFHESELAKLNYLLFPRWGDWAMLQIEPSNIDPLGEKVLQAGYFDEQWK